MTEDEAKKAYFERKQLAAESILHMLEQYDVPNPEQFLRCAWGKEERDGKILLTTTTTIDRHKLERFVLNTEAHLARIRQAFLSDHQEAT